MGFIESVDVVETSSFDVHDQDDAEIVLGLQSTSGTESCNRYEPV